jgi:hypothetical protein
MSCIPSGDTCPNSWSGKSGPLTSSGILFSQYSSPLFLKFPAFSFFCYLLILWAFLWLIVSNWASLSGLDKLSVVSCCFVGYIQDLFLSVSPTNEWLTLGSIFGQAFTRLRLLLEVHLN